MTWMVYAYSLSRHQDDLPLHTLQGPEVCQLALDISFINIMVHISVGSAPTYSY